MWILLKKKKSLKIAKRTQIFQKTRGNTRISSKDRKEYAKNTRISVKDSNKHSNFVKEMAKNTEILVRHREIMRISSKDFEDFLFILYCWNGSLKIPFYTKCIFFFAPPAFFFFERKMSLQKLSGSCYIHMLFFN